MPLEDSRPQAPFCAALSRILTRLGPHITQRTWVDKMGDHTPHEVDIIYPSLG